MDIALACKSLCDHNLRRPHLTCLYCRIRRMHYQKMPRAIKVRIHYIAVQVDPPRRLARVKDILFKRLMNVAEMLAA